MFNKHNNITVFFVVIAFLVTHAKSFANENTEALLIDYKNKYDSYLKAKNKWPNQLSQLKAIVNDSRAVHSLDSEKALNTGLVLENTKSEVEKQEQYLNFLIQIKPVSEARITSIKQRAVSIKEFSNTNQVTRASLESKAAGLDQEASSLNSQIQVENSKISEIKSTNSVYIDLTNQISDLNSRINQAQRNIDASAANLASGEANLQNLQSRLRTSRANEENARKRIIEINDIEIPAIRREKRDLVRSAETLSEDLQKARRRKKETHFKY